MSAKTVEFENLKPTKNGPVIEGNRIVPPLPTIVLTATVDAEGVRSERTMYVSSRRWVEFFQPLLNDGETFESVKVTSK